MREIREDQWRAELERLSKSLGKNDGDGLSPDEWAERMGWTRKKVENMLREAMNRGQLVRGRRMMERIDGRSYPMVVYAISKAKK